MFLKKLSFLLLILMALSTIIMAQTKDDYPANWKKVTELENKGLTKYALEEVVAIFRLATKDRNSAQQIKSVIKQIAGISARIIDALQELEGGPS